jgi:hypothetical protein
MGILGDKSREFNSLPKNDKPDILGDTVVFSPAPEENIQVFPNDRTDVLSLGRLKD